MKNRFEIVATAFDRKGRVIGSGVNCYRKTHPLAKYFSVKAGLSDQRVFIHAELAAVLSSGKKQIHSILVQRFNKNGDMALAKPCPGCMKMIEAFGVKTVFYTDIDGIKELKIESS